jgi:hypothetical protein
MQAYRKPEETTQAFGKPTGNIVGYLATVLQDIFRLE